MKKIPLLLTCLLSSPILNADQHSDEKRLLKSWGFQFNSHGQLIFSAQPQQDKKYLSWNPDLPENQISQPALTPPKHLEPVVISSKNKSGN